jgi:hypothetical protein
VSAYLLFATASVRDLIRRMQIAGTIGTGLFLGSGSALHKAGPLGALLAYALVGTVAYSYVQSQCNLPLPALTTLPTPPPQLVVFYW